MKFKDKYKISKEFEDLFSFNSEEDELEHEAQMLMFKFLEEVEKCYITGPGLKKKDIAEALGKSRSFISQIYSGDKLINFFHLAKLQKAFDLNFEIKAKLNTVKYSESASRSAIKSFSTTPEGTWVWMKNKPDYSKKDDCCDEDTGQNKNITAA